MKYLKVLASCFVIINYICFASVMKLLIRDEKDLQRFFQRQVTNHARAVLHIMGIELLISNPERLSSSKNYMLLSNHMSYLDAVILAALRPMSFVTSIEMREMPILGFLTIISGCLFTERRSKDNIQGEISQITNALKDGLDIVIFPEATSTNGEGLRPFKRALLAAAVESKTNILPLVIQYETIDGEKVTAKNRDLLCWYGKMTFGPHFMNLHSPRKIQVRVKVLEEIPVSAESNRDILVDQAYQAIHSAYIPIQA